MDSSILQEVILLLTDLYGPTWQNLEVSNLWLQELYTVVELNNGQVGLALNYDNEGFSHYRRQYNPIEVANALLLATERDPLLLNTLLRKQCISLCERSVLCAILSALSQPFLESTSISQEGYKITGGDLSLYSISRPGDTIHIVGFGGYLEQALASPHFVQVYVSDLKYRLPEGKVMIDSELERYKKTMRAHSIFVYDGQNYTNYIRRSDIVIITGSALCNGTMESLLEVARNAREVIIYGHSGVLLPSVYFQRGVTRLNWSTVPTDFLEKFKSYITQQDTTIPFSDFIDQILADSFTIHSPLAQKITPLELDVSVSHSVFCSAKNKEYSSGESSLSSSTNQDKITINSDKGFLLDNGYDCFVNGRFDWANYYFTKALETAVVSGDLRVIAECTYHLGLLNLIEGNESCGKEWLCQSRRLWTILGEKNREMYILTRLGESFLKNDPQNVQEECLDIDMSIRSKYIEWINQSLVRSFGRTFLVNRTLKAYHAYSKLPEEPIDTLRRGVESYVPYLKFTGELYDPLFDEPTQYGTAYYALCNAILAVYTECSKRHEYIVRAQNGLEAALAYLSDLTKPPTASGFRRDTGEICRANHRDFCWPAILRTYRLLTRLQTPGMDQFSKQISEIDIECAFSNRPPSNAAAVWLCGEWLRFRECLSPYTIDQFDEWIASFFKERILVHEGLYLEPGYPNSYDLFTRYHLADLLIEGYQGGWKNALEQLFANGTRRSLAFQLSDGSLASAYRSTGQTWTLGIQCAFFTHVANYFRERDPILASEAIQAAQRAYQAMQRWQRFNGPYSPVENCLPPSYRVGYEFYTADGHYGPLALSFLGLAILNGFRLSHLDLDVDVPLRSPFTYVEKAPTHRAVVHNGRYSLHVNALPTPGYDGLGIVDLTLGPGRYFHFVSSAKHLETGRIFNLGMACRNPTKHDELTVIAQQYSMQVISIEIGTTPASICFLTHSREQPYSYMLAAIVDNETGVYITESTPGLQNYKTLLIPYLKDGGTGSITEVQVRENKVHFVHGQEEIRITLDQRADKIIHLPYGFENRRGLCGLVRIDFCEPCERITYRVEAIR